MDTGTRAVRHVHGPNRWSQRKRLEYIDSQLHWERGINRRELVNRFGISLQQASADLSAYAAIAPANLEYDVNAKLYRSSSRFAPVYPQPDPATYLNALLRDMDAMHGDERSRLVPLDVVRVPVRSIQSSHLAWVLRAIREGLDLRIAYQSLRRPQLSTRWVSPHALASDGTRWHMRAWCHENGEFRDFVLSRIMTVEKGRESAIDPEQDSWWNEIVQIVVRANPRLTAAQRKAIEVDFKMTGGRFTIKCRKAMAFYYLRQLQLVKTPSTPEAHPIRLSNGSELVDVIHAGTKWSRRTAPYTR